MVRFADFYKILTEAKFRTLQKNIVSQAERITELYLNFVKQLTPKTEKILLRQPLDPFWQDYFEHEGNNVQFLFKLTRVKIKNLETNKIETYNVYVALGQDSKDYAICDTEYKIIVIYDNACRSLTKEKITTTIVHEITHGFQQYKHYTKKYTELKTQKSAKAQKKANALYYKEPVEFDAFTTELSYTIRREYQRIKNGISNSKLPETKKLLEKKLEKFLLELKLFIQSPLDTYFVHKELSLPSTLSNFEELLYNIQQDSKLWKSFKIKMVNLYNELIKSQ
jgi:hypothetical protein